MARSASPHNTIRSPFEAGQWDSFAVGNVIQNIRSRSAEIDADGNIVSGVMHLCTTIDAVYFCGSWQIIAVCSVIGSIRAGVLKLVRMSTLPLQRCISAVRVTCSIASAVHFLVQSCISVLRVTCSIVSAVLFLCIGASLHFGWLARLAQSCILQNHAQHRQQKYCMVASSDPPRFCLYYSYSFVLVSFHAWIHLLDPSYNCIHWHASDVLVHPAVLWHASDVLVQPAVRILCFLLFFWLHSAP